MKTATPLAVLLAACVARCGAGMWPQPQPQPMFGSAPPLVNRKVHASYINSSAGPIRVVQVVNVNVLPVRVSPPQGRDVEAVEEHDNSIPAFGSDDRRTQVDVFVNDPPPQLPLPPPPPPQPGRRPPPLRLTDYVPFLDSNRVPQQPAARDGHFLLPLAAYSHDAELHDDYLDQIVDFALEIICRGIHAKGKDEVTAPDLHREFVRKLGPLQLKGSFDATGGLARNLSTLRRTEPTTVSRQGETLQLRAGLGLTTLAARYDHYEARLGSLQAQGQLAATVASDSIAVTVNVSLGQANCLALQELRIDQLGDIDVKLTGLGELSWLTSKIVSWLSDHFKTEVSASVEQQLRDGVSQVLGRVKCDVQQFLSLSLSP
ncbi:uncharacterized protein LOC126322885 [Schistocerca gregaria]|uniref:uncharacterized protein LOC126322885 n=1 Tax=Schistocerca gregaria TaxID=7010 RepID=UPI00211E7CA5|nr:uncharacterized protein LOC126322885 [Schistocerca gregaria]